VLQPHHRVPTRQAPSRHRRTLVRSECQRGEPTRHTDNISQNNPTNPKPSRWESSQEGAELMLKYGLEYDHSFSHHDCQCYWLRTGDKWIPIDYSKHPDHWMKPLEAGVTTGLCEIPASWYADDLPPMMFIVSLVFCCAVSVLNGWQSVRLELDSVWLTVHFFQTEKSPQLPRLGQPPRRRRNVDGPLQVLLPRERGRLRLPRDRAPRRLRPPSRPNDARAVSQVFPPFHFKMTRSPLCSPERRQEALY
jgi:hypothetical protein